MLALQEGYPAHKNPIQLISDVFFFNKWRTRTQGEMGNQQTHIEMENKAIKCK